MAYKRYYKKKRYDEHNTSSRDAISKLNDWTTRWHPVGHPAVIAVLAWLGPNYTIYQALLIGILAFVLGNAIKVFFWRRKRLIILADAGLTDPGVFQMWKDYTREVNRFNLVKRQFAVACRTARIQGETGNKKTPTLRKMRTTADLDVEAEVVTAGGNGVTINDISSHASDIAEITGARDLVIRRTKSVGHAELTWYFTDPMGRVLRLRDVPESPKGTLAYGIRQDGSPAFIKWSQSVLIGGLTRSGKSVLIRALLADALKKGVYVDLYVGDTKDGVQMAEYSKHIGEWMGTIRVVDYQTTAFGTEQMLERMVIEKERRAAQLIESGQEQHWPTQEEPLMICILDETLPLYDMLKKGFKSPAGNIAFTGAALDCALWVNSQLGDKNALGDIRDLIPQAICFSTKTWQQADAVLGSGATQTGVACHEIGDEPGIGWSGAQDKSRYEKFRAANVTKAESIELSEGRYPIQANKVVHVKDEQDGVYKARTFPDATGGRRVLYIGHTNNLDARMKQHIADPKKPWFSDLSDPENEVDHADMIENFLWYPNTATALKQEEIAIKRDKPLYNDIHNRDNPARRTTPRGPKPPSAPKGWFSQHKNDKAPKAKPAKKAARPKVAASVTNDDLIWGSD